MYLNEESEADKIEEPNKLHLWISANILARNKRRRFKNSSEASDTIREYQLPPQSRNIADLYVAGAPRQQAQESCLRQLAAPG